MIWNSIKPSQFESPNFKDSNHLVEIKEIFEEIENTDTVDGDFQITPLKATPLQDRISQAAQGKILTERHWAEFTGLGPLEAPLRDASITEIMVLGPDQIWVEKQNQLIPLTDSFACRRSFENILDTLKERAGLVVTQEHPIGQGYFDQVRLQYVHRFITGTFDQVTLRKHPTDRWTLEKLVTAGRWGEDQTASVRDLVKNKKNFLVVGPTGSGKTSVIDAALGCLQPNERVVILEDTSELKCPNLVSTKLLTRFDAHGVLPEIDTHQLLRSALRMRPDRLVIGEIRGIEAKDFLLAVSTGHSGSLSSLHASEAQEALLRLEMLIQMAAPQWSLIAIRRLLMLSVDGLLVLGKRKTNESNLKGYWRLASHEDSGIILEQTF